MTAAAFINVDQPVFLIRIRDAEVFPTLPLQYSVPVEPNVVALLVMPHIVRNTHGYLIGI